MGYPTKVQLIQRQNSAQWYINFPAALAQAMEFSRGEIVEWVIEDRGQLRLRRLQPPAGPKKNGGTPRPLPRALGKRPARQLG